MPLPPAIGHPIPILSPDAVELAVQSELEEAYQMEFCENATADGAPAVSGKVGESATVQRSSRSTCV